MKIKKVIIATLLLCLLLIGAVSASESTTKDVVSSDVNNDKITTSTDNNVKSIDSTKEIKKTRNNKKEILKEGEYSPTSFKALNKTINDEPISTIELNTNYAYNESSDGEFKDGITISKEVTINGNGKTIDAKSKARIFNVISTGKLILNNLKLIKGNNNYQGGAINVEQGSLYINNCEFINNTQTESNGFGGAINVDGGNLDINNTLFLNNNATVRGGAIHVSNSNTNILNSNFTNNTVNGFSTNLWGGALSNCNAINCNFNNNQIIGQFGYGGAMENGNATNCNFTKNNATFGGAMANGNANHCTFINNNAANNGGATYYCNAALSTFINNTASYEGSAMYTGTDGSSLRTITLCIFENNDYRGMFKVNTVLLNVSNFTSTVNSGEKLLFKLKLKDGEMEFDDIPTTITITKNGRFIGNYTALSGKQNGWLVNLPSGVYNATLSIDKYTVDPVNITITINPIQSNFIIQKITNAIIKQKINITVTETNRFNGTVTVKIGNYEYNVTLNNGKGIKEINIPNVGTYKAIINFNGNENFTKDYAESNQFTISPKNKTKIKYSILNNIEGKVAIYIQVYNSITNEEIYNAQLKLTGSINDTIQTNKPYRPKLTPGKYKIRITYNNEYYTGNTTIKFKVLKNPNKTIKQLKNKLSKANKKISKANKKISKANKKISKANKKIKTYNTTIVKLKKQTKILKQIIQKQNKKLKKLSINTTKIIAKNKTFKTKVKTKKYIIKLQTNKKGVPTVQAYVTINGKKYKKRFTPKTNKKGQAVFKITKLNKKGKYTAIITFKGNTTIKFKVLKNPNKNIKQLKNKISKANKKIKTYNTTIVKLKKQTKILKQIIQKQNKKLKKLS